MAIYMQYPNIPGAVTEEGHKGWIEINSFQWGVGRGISTPVGRAENREASMPSVSEVTVTKAFDEKSSTKLLEAALTGEGVTVVIDFMKTEKGKAEMFAKYTLTNTMISGYSVSSGGDRPSESLSLNFTAIEFTGAPHGQEGKGGAPERVKYDLASGATK
ncbi:MAG: type VI secretion system tube protein Hcp [Planctomycetota bacterium]